MPKAPKGGKSKKSESATGVVCTHCQKTLAKGKKALYVEEDLNRVFCSEQCILDHFQPEIQRYENEYFDLIKAHGQELPPAERERLLPLRWPTLQEPGEVWVRPGPEGDRHMTMIREFQQNGQPLWCVCVTLSLRGDPSFLFIAAVTKLKGVAETYRRGEIAHKSDVKTLDAEAELVKLAEMDNTILPPGEDRVADEWSREDALRAHAEGLRNEEDIPQISEDRQDKLVEETLEKPDEVWTVENQAPDGRLRKYYHFIRQVKKAVHKVPMDGWFVVVAQDGQKADEIEIIDGFLTQRSEVVDGFRQGKQEMGPGVDEDPPRRAAGGSGGGMGGASGSGGRTVH